MFRNTRKINRGFLGRQKSRKTFLSVRNIFRKQRPSRLNWIDVDNAKVWVGTTTNGYSDYDISCDVLRGKTSAKVLDQKNGMRLIDVRPKGSEVLFRINIVQVNSGSRKIRGRKSFYARMQRSSTGKEIEINQWGEALIKRTWNS